MNETYPVSMALMDFVPVIFFGIGACYLVSVTAQLKGLRWGQIAAGGSSLIFLGGLLKAAWKLLIAAGIGSIEILSEAQFVLLAPGFLILLISALSMAVGEKAREPKPSLLTVILPWKIPFLIVMTMAGLGLQATLAVFSLKRKAYFAAAGFAVAFLGLLGMGAMASAPQTLAAQWIEQSVNLLGQAGFMVGSFHLRSLVRRREETG